MTILEWKAPERIKRIARAKPNSEEHAVLIGIVWGKDLDAQTSQGEVEV